MDVFCPKCGGATPSQEVGDGIPPVVECLFCGMVYWPPGVVDVEEMFVEEHPKGRMPPPPPARYQPGFAVRVIDDASGFLGGRQGLVEDVSGQFCRVSFPDLESTVWVPCRWLEPNA